MASHSVLQKAADAMGQSLKDAKRNAHALLEKVLGPWREGRKSGQELAALRAMPPVDRDPQFSLEKGVHHESKNQLASCSRRGTGFCHWIWTHG
jgi:hypothetical protein